MVGTDDRHEQPGRVPFRPGRSGIGHGVVPEHAPAVKVLEGHVLFQSLATYRLSQDAHFFMASIGRCDDVGDVLPERRRVREVREDSTVRDVLR